MADQTPHPPILARAAVRGSFDPLLLLDRNADSFGAESAYLAERSSEQRVGGRWLWTLTAEGRIEGLRQMPADPAGRARFLAANQPDSEDTFGRMLHRALTPRKDGILDRFIRAVAGTSSPSGVVSAGMSIDEQVALAQVIEALTTAGVAAPDWINADAARILRRSIAISEQKAATRVLLPDKFRGRTGERKLLLDFVDRGFGALAGLRKRGWLTINPAAPAVPTPIAAMAVSGAGGIGKSAVLASVRMALEDRPGITLITFDFDRPALRAGDSAALTIEMARQLSISEPRLDAALSETRRDLRHQLKSATNYELSDSAVLATVGQWEALFQGSPRLEQPLVFLMDTFEEVLVASEARVQTLARWASKLCTQVGFKHMRVIFFGRAVEAILRLPPSEIHIAAVIELGDLDIRAGQAKLADIFARLGVPHADQVGPLTATFGTNPLVLEILGRYAVDKTRDEILGLIEEGKRGEGKGLKAEFAQRFLYSRILGRLKEPDVQNLAHPGLVLRRVDKTLIAEVLAGPCGLGEVGDQRAHDLLEMLRRQVWLVDPGGGDEVVHRRDARRLMLPQILAEPKGIAVARAAADWYARDTGSREAEFESIYYSALAGLPVPAEPAILRALADHLGPDIEDLPTPLRALAKEAAGGRSLSQAELAALPEENRRRVLSRRRRKLVSEGLESVVIEQVSAAPARAARGPADPADVGPSLDSVAESASSREWSPEYLLEDEYFARRDEHDPEVVQSLFNHAEFGPLSREVVPLFGQVLRSVLDATEPGRLSVLEHPAYLAAISAVLDEAAAARLSVHRLLDAVVARTGPAAFADAVQRGIRLALSGQGEVAVAFLILVLAGVDLRQLPGLDQSRELPMSPPARETAVWRVHMALRRLLGTSPLAAAPTLFPLFSPTLLDLTLDDTRNQTLGEPVRFEYGGGGRLEPFLEALRSIRTRSRVTLSDLNHIEQMAQSLTLVIRWRTQPPGFRQAAIVGRTPELYGAVRSTLLRFGNLDRLTGGIDALRAGAGLWPAELEPTQFLKPGAALNLVPALVETADRFGLLGQLIDIASATDGAPPAIHAVRQVYRSFVETWTAGDDYSQATPLRWAQQFGEGVNLVEHPSSNQPFLQGRESS
jgi:hypothetical protein